MGKMIRLKAADGHELDAYVEEPAGPARGGVVVVQEIFGITDHIKRVVHEHAAAGYHAIAPAMFDRIERGIVLPYSDVQGGRGYVQQLQWPSTLADVDAAIAHVGDGGCAVIGFCWGGTVAHVVAGDLSVDAVVSYYGAAVAKMLDKRSKCPIMYQFGDQDHSIPLADVDTIKEAQPEAIVHVYPGARHGFNCEDRESFSASDARLAFGRSLLFLRERVG
jgi:carboxymethylenebutenolidase